MKRGFTVLTVLVVLAASLAPSGAGAAAPADRQREIDQEVRRVRQQLGDAADQEAELIAELTVSRRTRQQLDAEVAQLDGAIAVAQAEQARVDSELSQAVASEQAASEAVDAAERDLRDARSLLRRQAVDAYMSFGTTPDLTYLLVTIDDVNDAPRVAAYVDAVAERQARAVTRMRTLQRDTSKLEADAKQARAVVAARQREAMARRAALQAARVEQDRARAAVAAEAATEQRLLAEVQGRRRSFQQRLDQLQRESNEIAAQLRRRQSGQPVRAGGRGVLGYPVANPFVTSAFGYRIHPIYGDRRLHAGIDLRGGIGTPVLAAGDGVVVFAGWKSGYGNTVVIDHGGQLATLYGHNDSLSVVTGQTVRRGQQVAAAGSSGNSTGPHLHFEVRVSGTPVDPMRYL